MTENYDAFIIGTGAAGTTFAYKLRDAGMKVGIADCRQYGGTCALRGCIPKKCSPVQQVLLMPTIE